MTLSYRKNVAAFVLNQEGKILLCERSDIPNSWQLPQGGVEENEDLEAAMLRELSEEIGTSEVTILDQLTKGIKYDWPKKLHKRGFCGQEQFYFLARLDALATIKFGLVNGEQEFVDYRWVKDTEFESIVKSFKREVYLKALKIFQERNPELIIG